MTILDLKDKLYTSTEVANILGVSLRSVYRYLEENKLNADVKTATGRHRFSKQNIMDFLYPDRSNEVKKPQTDKKKEDDAVKNTYNDYSNNSQPIDIDKKLEAFSERQDPLKVNNTDNDVLEDDDVLVDSSTALKDVQEEPVDWLARFRAAAEKYRAEQASVDDKDNATTTKNEPLHVDQSKRSIDSFIPKYEEVVVDEKNEYYYLSGIGGLKDIAQGLDKAAKKASVDYSFTLDAGLSLFKPIRPFSLIHAYVRPQDREYFEKALKLTEVSKNSAQLCLIMSDDRDLYSSKTEMYGLSVVSKERLKLDLIANGEKDLVSELDNIA